METLNNTETVNLYQRLAAATAEMETVAKNLNITAGRNSYKAVSERDVIDAVKKVEAKHGIYSYPAQRRVIESATLESETNYNGQTVKKTTFFLRLETVYRFLNIDRPEEYIEVTTYGDGMDAGDKATGKAMTYADKYALMKAYKISTGDDPDQQASEERGYTRKKGPSKDFENLVAEFTAPGGEKPEMRRFCETCGIPEEWIAGKYGYKNFDEMPDFLLADMTMKKDTIRTAYQKEEKK